VKITNLNSVDTTKIIVFSGVIFDVYGGFNPH